MKAFDKGYHLPVVFGLFGIFFVSMLAYDLWTGEVWRGGPKPAITLANDVTEFYVMIFFLAVMSLIWWGGVVWTLVLLLRRKAK
jgi:hypothetical protein